MVFRVVFPQEIGFSFRVRFFDASVKIFSCQRQNFDAQVSTFTWHPMESIKTMIQSVSAASSVRNPPMELGQCVFPQCICQQDSSNEARLHKAGFFFRQSVIFHRAQKSRDHGRDTPSTSHVITPINRGPTHTHSHQGAPRLSTRHQTPRCRKASFTLNSWCCCSPVYLSALGAHRMRCALRPCNPQALRSRWDTFDLEIYLIWSRQIGLCSCSGQHKNSVQFGFSHR